MSQSEHEAWNSSNWPGTRQMCAACDCPTGRCEEDGNLNDEGEPVCDSCFNGESENG